MIPGAFDYHRPSSVSEAVKLLSDLGDEARVLAGGHSLIPMMKLRMAIPEHIIDLQDIAGLRGITESGGSITIGAMTTQAEVIESAVLAKQCPILPEASAQIADPQVRNFGTVGGNVANGDPGNDLPALMQALDASYLIEGVGGSRAVSARSFYEAAFFTALKEDEILTAVRFKALEDGHGFAYEKQKRKIGDYATAAAAVILTIKSGTCDSAAVSLTNVGDTPIFAEAAGQALVGSTLDKKAVDAAVDAAAALTNPSADGRGPSDFRRHVAGVMLRRAIARAAERAA